MSTMRSLVPVLGMLAVLPAGAAGQNTLPGKLKWNGTNDAFVWYWKKSNGTVQGVYGGGAYSAKLQLDATGSTLYWPTHGTTGFGPAVDIYCIDFLHRANTSTGGYNVYFTNLTGPLTNTRSNSLADYLQTAWLADQLETYGITTSADRQARAQIHAAMWWILSGQPTGVWNGSGSLGVSSSYVTMGAANAWVNLAQTGYASVNVAAWSVITPKCVTTVGNNLDGAAAADRCGQEFLARNVVPEPGSLLLLGTGLAGVLLAGRRRRRDAA